MSTSTDASTVLSEATRLAEGTTIEEHTANGAAVPVGERPAVNGAPPVEEDTLTHGGAAPDESGTAADPSSGERTPSAGDTAAGEGTAVDRPASPDGSVPVDASEPASWLRIEKGHAEPEEIAAISVVLCARLAGLQALAEAARPEEPPPGKRHPAHRSACWSGCWTCG